MKAEIIAVGTELLLGQVINTNAAFLAEELADLGIEVYYQTVVGDNPQRLAELITEAEQRSELLVLCGGLGPTEDDLTKQVVATHLGRDLVQDQQGLKKMEQHFIFSGRRMTENNLLQTLYISGGTPLANTTGLASGSFITVAQHHYLLLPGPPSELQPMFRLAARPLLTALSPVQERIVSRVLRFYGIGESQLVTELADLIAGQTNPTIAPYAKPNEVTLRLTAKASDESVANQLLQPVIEEILARLGQYYYGEGETTTLAQVVVAQLQAAGQTITAAESLTAGLFQSTLGDVPGVSSVFPGGFVTYSAATKMAFLDIDPQLIEIHGAVSEACAKAMAQQAREKAHTDLAVAFTGVAGPEPLEGKPAGTVWIAVASQQGVRAELCHFNRDRAYIRHSAVMKGLDMVRRQK